MFNQIVFTDKQINNFKSSGYLVIREGLSGDEVQKIKLWTDKLSNMPEESGKYWVYHEDSLLSKNKRLVNRIENIAAFHSGFRALTSNLKAPISQLLGEEAVLFKEKINFKLPGGAGFKPHQDSQAGWNSYAKFFVSALISIDESTLENGCLEISGGHSSSKLYDSWRPISNQNMKNMTFIPIPTKPGDIIFFDSFTPHKSASNRSKNPRRMYYATYNALSAGDNLNKYYADKHKSYPPDIDRIKGKKYVFKV